MPGKPYPEVYINPRTGGVTTPSTTTSAVISYLQNIVCYYNEVVCFNNEIVWH